ncbi:MAG TPA: hypothetical protein VF316_14550 [Polyangiaceae bacterium]
MKTRLLLGACAALAILGAIAFFLRRSSGRGGVKTATLRRA